MRWDLSGLLIFRIVGRYDRVLIWVRLGIGRLDLRQLGLM